MSDHTDQIRGLRDDLVPLFGLSDQVAVNTERSARIEPLERRMEARFDAMERRQEEQARIIESYAPYVRAVQVMIGAVLLAVLTAGLSYVVSARDDISPPAGTPADRVAP